MTNRLFARPLLLAVAVVLVGFLPVADVTAQDDATIPRNSEAERMFEQGLSAFERGDYQTAYDRFRLVNDYPLNRKTTAALLMSGKTLIRLGRYQEAIDRLQTLLNRYPETTYRSEAESAINLAQKALRQEGGATDTLHIGIALPMSQDKASLSQALFNGIRLAVDEHNGTRRRYVLPTALQASPDTFDVYNTAEEYSDSLANAEGRTTVATATDTMQVDSLRVVTEQVRRPEWVAKMHFRRVEGGPEGAKAAVDSLIRRDQVDVILGPLYSQESQAAGERAEQGRVLLVAPLATDESVSAGRDYVFQANPTIPLRGKIMARFAKNSLLADRVGIIYEQSGNGSQGGARSRDWARGFREEAKQQGIDIPFTLRLDNPRDWSRLPDAVAEDSTLTDSLLAAPDAVYLPMSGRNAAGKIQDALTGLGRLNTTARVLGNAEWHDLPIKQEASKFTATYTNDFYVQSKRPEVQSFIRQYRILTGETPGALSGTGQRLAFTGYDVTRFLLSTLTPSGSRPRPEALRTAPPYEGLGVRIDFQNGNVNEAMFLHRYRNGRIELLR